MIDVICKEVIKELQINQFIETGTDKGETVAETSRWFSELSPDFGIIIDFVVTGAKSYNRWNEPISFPIFSEVKLSPYQIHSIDIDIPSYKRAKKLFESNRNIHIHQGSSESFLADLLSNGTSDNRFLFFLDAHWGKYWPLRDELKEIIKLKKFIIVIDDFLVPGKSNIESPQGMFGFDVYEDRVLNWAYICDLFKNINVRIFYPEKPNRDKRGWVLIAHGYNDGELEFLNSLDLFELNAHDKQHTTPVQVSQKAQIQGRGLIKKIVPLSILRFANRIMDRCSIVPKQSGALASKMVKKIQFLKEIGTLYTYILHRSTVKVRSFLHLPEFYPCEDEYLYDKDTQGALNKIKDIIPDHLRGDNPLFTKNWKSIFIREDKAVEISQNISKVVEIPAALNQYNAPELVDVGYTSVEELQISLTHVEEIHDYLTSQKVYPSHVPHFSLFKPRDVEWVIRNGHPFGSYDLQTIIRAPHVTRLLSSPEAIGRITNYFGCLPTISSINMFWSFKSKDGKSKGPQRYHRDVDDYKTNTMFINLTDTEMDDGAHCYVRKSHTVEKIAEIFDDHKNDTLPKELNPLDRRLRPEDFFDLPLNGYAFDKLYKHFFEEYRECLYGPKGSVIITDNYGIHRGIPPQNHHRLILWVSFALTSTHTLSAGVKPQKRPRYSEVSKFVEDSKINRYVLRNMIDFT